MSTHVKVVKHHGISAALQQVAVDPGEEVREAAVHTLHATAVAADLPVLQGSSSSTRDVFSGISYVVVWVLSTALRAAHPKCLVCDAAALRMAQHPSPTD